MKNSEMPATPAHHVNGWGLTKLEYACIHCGVPETGDPDLDAIIAKGNKQKAAKDGLSLRQINALNAITPIGGQ